MDDIICGTKQGDRFALAKKYVRGVKGKSRTAMQRKGVQGMVLCKQLAKEAVSNLTMKSEISQMRSDWEAKCEAKTKKKRKR